MRNSDPRLSLDCMRKSCNWPPPHGQSIPDAIQHGQLDGDRLKPACQRPPFWPATGSVVYQIDGQPAQVLHPGDVFYEPEGARIARFDAQDDGVTFLAYFLLSPDQEPELTMLA